MTTKIPRCLSVDCRQNYAKYFGDCDRCPNDPIKDETTTKRAWQRVWTATQRESK
jgi:hypothetical protein